MANAQIGVNNGTSTWIFDGSMHEAWVENFSITGLGRMIQVDTYCAAASGGGTGGAAGWFNRNFTIQKGTWPSLGAGSGTSGAWMTTTGDVACSSTDTWQFGFYASNGVWVIYHQDGGLTQVKATGGATATGGTNVNAYAGQTGSMPSLGTYFIVEIYVRRSGSWVKCRLWVRRGSSWVIPDVYVRRGGVWQPVGRLAENVEFDPYREFEIMIKENETWLPGILRWKGPHYLGSASAIELYKGRHVTPHIYELVAA